MHKRTFSLSILAALACSSNPPEGEGSDGSSGVGVGSVDSEGGGSGGSEGNGTTGADGDGDGDGSGDGSNGSGNNDGGGTGDSGGSTTTADTSGGPNPTDDGGSETMDCPSAQVQFEPIVPTVILLVDRSGSMTEDFEPNVERWDAVRDALIDPDAGVIAGLQASVRFGLSLYTFTAGGQNCPNLTEVAPAVGNLDPITDVYADAEPPQNGETPTGDSIVEVTAALLADQTEGPKIIVLATDGEPDTCAQPNPQNGQDEAVAAVEAAFGVGIETYIIGVGNDVSSGHLQDMANAGVGVAADAPFYRPSDQDDLIATFESIVNGVRTCVFELDGAIVDGFEDEGVVTVNGEEIPYQDPNGWDVIDPTHIELFGDACDSVQTGEVEVLVEFPCGAIVPQ